MNMEFVNHKGEKVVIPESTTIEDLVTVYGVTNVSITPMEAPLPLDDRWFGHVDNKQAT